MGKHYKEKAKRTPKQKVFHLIYIIILLIFIILFIMSAINIVKWYLNNRENKKIQEEISKAITVNEEEQYTVDFDTLKEKNSDTVGWLKVNGTQVEYVVVKTTDNEYYLTHNFEKNYNKAGWIFADYKNKLNGTDKNIVIYGHNIRDDSMFGTLKDIINEEWYNNEENHKVIFITENEYAIYEVFSVYQIEEEDYYIQTEFKNEAEFEEFIETIKLRSVKVFDVDVTSEDNVLTLSTCADNNKYRVVLHAKKNRNRLY